MKICPECHKLSRDDDFCSHCGAAVYPDNSYSGSNISCENYREFDGGAAHTHAKQSYTQPYPSVPAKPGAGTYQSSPAEGGRKSKGGGCVSSIVVAVIVICMFFSVIDSLDIDFWGWLGNVLEEIYYSLI